MSHPEQRGIRATRAVRAERTLRRFFAIGAGKICGGLLVSGALNFVGCAHPDAFARAQSMARGGHTEGAIKLLETSLSAPGQGTNAPDSPHVRERRLLVRLRAAAGDLEGAKRETITLRAELGDKDPVPLLELGHAYELAKQFDEALGAYDEAAALAPTDPRGPKEGGTRAAHWGEVEMASPRLLEALRRDPSDASVWHTLGLVRLRSHDLAGSEAAYRKGAALEQDTIDNLVGLATVVVAREDGAAIVNAYDAILRQKPLFAAGWLGRAYGLLLMHKWTELEAALGRAEDLGAERKHIQKIRSAATSAIAAAKGPAAPTTPGTP